MLYQLRQRTADEGGFTLIELLVVVLIIGILSAIAIPAFLSQTSKANDSAAKTQVGTLQTTLETYASEHNGTFETEAKGIPSEAEVAAIEPTLKDKSQAKWTITAASATGYTIESESISTKDKFVLTDTAGSIVRTCTVANPASPGGCKGVVPPAKTGTW
jgi:type IV pilus assembly protein PilA